MGSHALGVRGSLRNPFAIELLNFVDEVQILKKHWSTSSSGEDMLIIVDRAASSCGEHVMIDMPVTHEIHSSHDLAANGCS
jgi:hypothetical protein